VTSYFKVPVIKRLLSSFVELESAIDSARSSLSSKGSVPPSIFERLDSYDTILSKQRELADNLSDKIEEGEWEEVARLVKLINGLSSMIRDDAHSILSAFGITKKSHPTLEDSPIC
jgi:hypothetical protein